jgi:D-alanyl-D-alanine carboxypeptidase (penicillin-binding protein 5/6)
MPKKIIIPVTVFLVISFLAIVIRFIFKKPTQEQIFVSPVPQVATSIFRQGKPAIENIKLWYPDEKKISQLSQTPPIITGESAFSVDITTQKVLLEKNSRQRRPASSLIKIMTAIIALENASVDREITVSQKAATIGEDSMGLTAGERYSLRELLYGLLLVSGNDAAEAISEGVAGREDIFVSLMNAKAVSLNLNDTKFVNPSGLDGDGEHYSTAYDLMIMTQYALRKFPLFREIVATKEYIIPKTENHKQIYLGNETNLLRTYPGVMGVKTGYTPASGLCLITLLQNQGQEILAVVLDSADRRVDMKKILDFSRIDSRNVTKSNIPLEQNNQIANY